MGISACVGMAVGFPLAQVMAGAPEPAATWIGALRPSERNSAIQELLDRRTAAVRAKDRAAFLADVDTADPDFLRRQGVVFENLVRMPFAELSFRVEPTVGYPRAIPQRLGERFNEAVFAPGVTITYRVDGVDSRPVTAPWVPVLGYADGRWVIAGEAGAEDLPYGANGQAWDAGPISVARSTRVVAVLSADDASRADYLLRLAETALNHVGAVRSGGWEGKVVVTAVQDQRIFDAYFSDSPDRIAQVAAIAVPYYDRIADWHKEAAFATTRVVFNPKQLSAQPEQLAHDLAHEFVHAAMGSVTIRATPRWLVEGFAEYVSYRSENVSPAALRRLLRNATVGDALPVDSTFYSDSGNYVVSWLACRMIAERHGEQRLVELYESFQRRSDQDANVSAALGVSLPTLTAQWRDYVNKIKG